MNGTDVTASTTTTYSVGGRGDTTIFVRVTDFVGGQQTQAFDLQVMDA